MIFSLGRCGFATRNGRYALTSSSSESFPSWTARIMATPTKGLAMEPTFMTVSGVNGRVRLGSAKPYPFVHTTCRSTMTAAPSPMIPTSAIFAVTTPSSAAVGAGGEGGSAARDTAQSANPAAAAASFTATRRRRWPWTATTAARCR